MPRGNPVVEQLRWECDQLRKQLEERRKPPPDDPSIGCGDGSCLIRSPQGMHTNGGCRCDERRLRMALQWWKRRAAFLEETIGEQREQMSGLLSELSVLQGEYGELKWRMEGLEK